MTWWDLVNPFGYLGDAAASLLADGWTVAMLASWNAGLWLLKLVLMLEEAFLTPDLSSSGPMGGVYQFTFWIAGAFALILLMVQLGIAAIRRDGQSLARVLLGGAQFVMVWVAWIAYSVAVLAAAAGLSKALMRALLDVEVLAAWEPWTGFSTGDITDGTVATVLGVLGVFLIFAAVTHLLVMLTRAAALVVLAATGPIAAAGLMWEGGRAWFWKSFRWFHAAAFTPVIMILVLGLGVQVTNNVALSMSDSLQSAIGTAVPGVFLILVGSFAPLALFKLLAFVDPGTSSGAAMRTGLAAQGGLSGLLQGSRADGSGSTAAAQSAPDGTSQGEASAEAATSQRVANSAGGLAGAFGPVGAALGTGLGMVVGAGTAAAAIGADLSNQMGVGHNTYIPDFTTNRRQGGTGGPSQNHPDINGADEHGQPDPNDHDEQSRQDEQGGQGRGGPWPQPPTPAGGGGGATPAMPAPAAAPTSGSAGGAGGAAAGGAAAGGGGAGAGGAAAIPPV